MSGPNVTTYLLNRLAAAGVDRVFGVPGDFTLALLDDIEAHETVHWVGCANELGAGYAADGYARVRGLGAVCTTFGVGELGTISAIAGAFAEHVPVIHIVGAPATAIQNARRATHHTLGDGDFGHFARMTAEVTHVQAVLTPDTACSEIDRVIRATLTQRRPGYILIPADVAKAPVQPACHHLELAGAPTDPVVLDHLRSSVRVALGEAISVGLLADVLVQRMGAEKALRDLLALGVPHAVSLWGRRVVDETSPFYVGPYIGAASDATTRAAIEGADLLIMAGVQFTDLMSGFFSQRLPPNTIVIEPQAVHVNGRAFAPVAMTDALAIVAAALAGTHLVPAEPHRIELPSHEAATAGADTSESAGPLDQAGLWTAVTRQLRGGDIILADQGTSFYGMGTHRMPAGAIFIGQPLWASIGYTLPALLGAALADPTRRPVVLIGDGAAQLTIGELGTLIRHRVPAVVLVVNNGGYTVERAIHGRRARYNDIAAWNWTALVRAFDPAGFARGVRATTTADVTRAFAEHDAHEEPLLTLIEAVTPALDVPPLLTALAKAAEAANRIPPPHT